MDTVTIQDNRHEASVVVRGAVLKSLVYVSNELVTNQMSFQ
jgi:hypothetical protein